MTVPYFTRLVCLSLAFFFFAHLVLTSVVRFLASRAVQIAGRMPPGDGARLLFALRLAPATLAGSIVAGLCVPSYFWLEPADSTERIGSICLAAAVLGAAAWSHAIARVVRAAIRSRQYLRSCEHAIESDAPVLLLAGVFHARLVVSRGVRRALTADQLAVALRHERAHGDAHDNLKRLLLLLTPDALPFVHGLRPIEQAWKRLAEWAADDRAVAGSRRRSLALASALVRMARIASIPPPPLATSLLGDSNDLAVRVERLLQGAATGRARAHSWPAVAIAIVAAAIALQPATLVAVHRALEALAQ